MHDHLIQQKLDLNEDGDFDFNRKPNRMYQASRKANRDPKEVKFSQQSDAQSSESEKNYNRNNSNNSNGDSTNSRTRLSQFAKNVFSRKSNNEKLLDSSTTSSVGKETNSKLKEKLLRANSNSSGGENNTNKYIEMQDISLNSSNPSRDITLETIKINTNNNNTSPNPSDRDVDAGNTTNRWSITNDSIKGFDSENEEIPLVITKKQTSHQKKKSGHSIITVIPNTASAVPAASSKLSGLPANVAKSKQQTKLITEHHDTGPKKTSTNSSAASKTMGAENEGFNETNF